MVHRNHFCRKNGTDLTSEPLLIERVKRRNRRDRECLEFLLITVTLIWRCRAMQSLRVSLRAMHHWGSSDQRGTAAFQMRDCLKNITSATRSKTRVWSSSHLKS